MISYGRGGNRYLCWIVNIEFVCVGYLDEFLYEVIFFDYLFRGKVDREMSVLLFCVFFCWMLFFQDFYLNVCIFCFYLIWVIIIDWWLRQVRVGYRCQLLRFLVFFFRLDFVWGELFFDGRGWFFKGNMRRECRGEGVGSRGVKRKFLEVVGQECVS